MHVYFLTSVLLEKQTKLESWLVISITIIAILLLCFYRLTQLLEDVQKVLSINIDESDEETLAKISEDFSTIQNLWTKVQQQSAEQTLTGRHLLIFWHLSGDEKQIEIHCGLSVKKYVQRLIKQEKIKWLGCGK